LKRQKKSRLYKYKIGADTLNNDDDDDDVALSKKNLKKTKNYELQQHPTTYQWPLAGGYANHSSFLARVRVNSTAELLGHWCSLQYTFYMNKKKLYVDL